MADGHGDEEERTENHTSDDGINRSFIGRRGFLGAAAAGVGLAGLGSWAGASAQEPGEGPSDVVNLGEEGASPGDDLTPYLEEYWEPGVKVVIPGATYELSDPEALEIDADEDAWLIGDGEVFMDHGEAEFAFSFSASDGSHLRLRNITLKGTTVGGDSKLRLFTFDEDSLAEMINFNRPDGTENGEEATGFYVPDDHAGVSRFVNCHIEGFSDNGLYGSAPGGGESGDKGGAVEVLGGLYKNNDVAGIRIGSDDSKAVSTVVVNDATAPNSEGADETPVQRGIRIREAGENIAIDDCDITHLDEDGVSSPIEIENESFTGDPPSNATVTDTRIRNDTASEAINGESDDYDITANNLQLSGDGSFELDGSGPFENLVTGSDAIEPVTTKRWVTYDGIESPGQPPAETPTKTPEETPTDTPEPTPTPTPPPTQTPTPEPAEDHRLVVRTQADPRSGVIYRFVVDGTVLPGENAEVDDNDSITENGDGTVTVEGTTGGGFTDDFRFDGEIVDWEARTHPDETNGSYELLLDGELVSPEELSADPVDPPLAVETGNITNLTGESVTLTGSVTSLGGADSVSVAFDWGEAGGDLPNATAAEAVSETGQFTAAVSGLDAETEYAFRAVVAGDGDEVESETTTFTTPPVEGQEPGEGTSPSVDTFDVTEAGSRNAGADILVNWAVSDDDADLQSVLVQVLDAPGTVVDATRRSVDGSEAYDVEYFRISGASGRSFNVQLTVTDEAGNTASTGRTVTE